MLVTRAGLDKSPHAVAAMFDEVAARYDRTNDVLSFGQDRLWRRGVAAAVAAEPGDRILDVAAGTGSSSDPFVGAGAYVVAADFSLGMMRQGARSRPSLRFVAGDALDLPFADDSFDAVTISFGLRNVADVPAALAEMRRVTRPGGRLVICECSHPVWPPFRVVYMTYLMRVLPQVARVVGSNAAAYRYLSETIRDWPDQRTLAAMITEAGWRDAQWRNLTGGIAALHRATAP
jgi:demethylmenaquinone methyltransferase/2-methoxy-6-polyprenyl-1,4-benzoquinol methylase